jgi:F420-0:gamma-glutamyl ligase
MPHVEVAGSLVEPRRRAFDDGDAITMPTVLCGKCWHRVHRWLDIVPSEDAAAIRRHRKNHRRRKP